MKTAQFLSQEGNPLLLWLGLKYGLICLNEFGPQPKNYQKEGYVYCTVERSILYLTQLINQGIIEVGQAISEFEKIKKAGLLCTIDDLHEFMRQVDVGYIAQPEVSFYQCEGCDFPIPHGHIVNNHEGMCYSWVIGSLASGFEACIHITKELGVDPWEATSIFQTMMRCNLLKDQNIFEKAFRGLSESIRQTMITNAQTDMQAGNWTLLPLEIYHMVNRQCH